MSSISPPEPPADNLIAAKQPSHQPASSVLKEKHPKSSRRRQHPLDARFDRLIKDVLPSAPYLLRLRNRSAQYHGRDRYYWRKDTHFDEDEEELQYLTFRPTHDGTLLYAHGQWDDGNGGIAPKDLPSSQTSSGQTPLKGQVPTKKITLADYAKLDKSKSRTPDTKDPSSKQEAEKTLPEASQAPEKEKREINQEIKKTSHPDSMGRSLEGSGATTGDPVHKRSADAMTGASDKAPVDQETSSPPSKKSRLNDDPTSGVRELTKEAADLTKDDEVQNEHEHDIGPRDPEPISAVPSKVEELQKSELVDDSVAIPEEENTTAVPLPAEEPKFAPRHGLPPMLSPTLPADVEEELAKLTPGILGGLTSSRVSSASPQLHSKDHKRDISTGPKAKPSSHNLTPSTPTPITRDPKRITSAPRQPHEDGTSDLKSESVGAKKSLMVVIKFRKSNRKTLDRITRMRATPNRGRQTSMAKSNSADARSNAESNKVLDRSKSSKSLKPLEEDESSGTDEPLAKKKSGKRRAADSNDDDMEERKPKRAKGSNQQQHDEKAARSTPSQTLPKSAQKGHLNIVSTAMQRTASQESAATPARDVTPTTNGHKSESPERVQWKKDVRTETARLIKLATKIKHSSDVYLKQMTGDEYEANRQLGSVIATEAILCFMLAAIVGDEPSRSAKTHSDTDLWKSTRDFISWLSSSHAKRFQHLYGFLKLLEGIVCDTLTYQHDMRGDSILREYNRLKKGAQEPDATSMNAESHIAENWAWLKEAQETRFRARAAWREGQMCVYDPELEREFPKTWTRRRDFAGRGKGKDPVTLNNYSKEGFALPLGTNSTALDAVNCGLSLLTELCEKQGLEWTPQLII